LKEEGIIKWIAPLFNFKKFGWCSTLCGMRVEEERMDEVSGIVNQYDEITHSYERAHPYNLWFTIIAKEDELPKIIDEIKDKTGVDDLVELPSVNRYKIGFELEI
jgi:DNA-binding Lrp family transcriptional regulator